MSVETIFAIDAADRDFGKARELLKKSPFHLKRGPLGIS